MGGSQWEGSQAFSSLGGAHLAGWPVIVWLCKGSSWAPEATLFLKFFFSIVEVCGGLSQQVDANTSPRSAIQFFLINKLYGIYDSNIPTAGGG